MLQRAVARLSVQRSDRMPRVRVLPRRSYRAAARFCRYRQPPAPRLRQSSTELHAHQTTRPPPPRAGKPYASARTPDMAPAYAPSRLLLRRYRVCYRVAGRRKRASANSSLFRRRAQ